MVEDSCLLTDGAHARFLLEYSILTLIGHAIQLCFRSNFTIWWPISLSALQAFTSNIFNSISSEGKKRRHLAEPLIWIFCRQLVRLVFKCLHWRKNMLRFEIFVTALRVFDSKWLMWKSRLCLICNTNLCTKPISSFTYMHQKNQLQHIWEF